MLIKRQRIKAQVEDLLLVASPAASSSAEFQKILDDRGLVSDDIYWSRARLGLACAYAQIGDTEKNLVEYRKLLNLWKNADPDPGIFKEANAEYNKLRKYLPSAVASPGNAKGIGVA
jgi:hypothetical protein